MSKYLDISREDYLTAANILKVCNKPCTNDKPVVFTIKFELKKFENMSKGGKIRFVYFYESIPKKYVLTQEYSHIPTHMRDNVMVTYICCDKHFPKEEKDALCVSEPTISKPPALGAFFETDYETLYPFDKRP